MKIQYDVCDVASGANINNHYDHTCMHVLAFDHVNRKSSPEPALMDVHMGHRLYSTIHTIVLSLRITYV